MIDDATRTIEPESPSQEREIPKANARERTDRTPLEERATKPIDAKDNRAFWLAAGCLIALATFCVADICIDRDIFEESKMLSSFVDIVKYVITTALGFFFATTVSRKE